MDLDISSYASFICQFLNTILSFILPTLMLYTHFALLTNCFRSWWRGRSGTMFRSKVDACGSPQPRRAFHFYVIENVLGNKKVVAVLKKTCHLDFLELCSLWELYNNFIHKQSCYFNHNVRKRLVDAFDSYNLEFTLAGHADPDSLLYFLVNKINHVTGQKLKIVT